MKKIQTHLLYYIVCITCSFACTKPYPKSISHVEDIIGKHPQSALIVLDSIKDQIQQEPPSTIMYYNLLLAEACDRCDIPFLNDSLIPAITQYYEKANERNNLMKSYYFMGRRHLDLNSQDDPTAFTYFLKALDASAGSKEHAFLGRIHHKTGKSFTNMNLLKIAISNHQKAFHYYQLEKDSINSTYVLQDIAKAYDLLGEIDSTLYYYQKAYHSSEQTRDEEKATILQELASIYIRINQCDEALKALQKMAGLQIEEQYQNYNIRAELYLKRGQKDSAAIYFEKEAEKNHHLSANKYAYWNLFLINKEHGNCEQGLSYLEKYVQCSDSIYKQSNIQSLQKIKTLYDTHHIEIEKENLRKEKMEQRGWIIGIMITLAIAIGILIQYYRIRQTEIQEQKEKLLHVYNEQYLKSQQRIEDNKKRIEELEKRAKEVQQEKDELTRKLLLARKEKLEQANQAIEISRKEQALLEESLRKSDIYAHCYRAIENASITLTDDDWQTLTVAINEAYDNFTDRLFVLHPSITIMELHICLLVKIQLPTSAISQLVYRTQSAISMSRKQLYKKIFKKDGTPAQLDEFIRLF